MKSLSRHARRLNVRKYRLLKFGRRAYQNFLGKLKKKKVLIRVLPKVDFFSSSFYMFPFLSFRFFYLFPLFLKLLSLISCFAQFAFFLFLFILFFFIFLLERTLSKANRCENWKSGWLFFFFFFFFFIIISFGEKKKKIERQLVTVVTMMKTCYNN